MVDVAGEYIRSDVRNGEAGVDLVLDTQVLDIKTCEPIPDVYLEIWRRSNTLPILSLH